MKVSLIQMNSTADKAENLKTAKELITKDYKKDKPDLVVLPEMFNRHGGRLDERDQVAEIIGEWPIIRRS